MRALGGRFHDMDTLANLIVTPPKGSGDEAHRQRLTITAHLYLKMPDNVKFQVLNSNFPLINRWIFLQVGNRFEAYDPVSDRRVATDFRRLTGRDPGRLDTKMATLGLLFDPSRYKFQWLGRSTADGTPVYHIRMRLPKPEQLNPFTTIAYTDMFVDTVHYAPVRSASYDAANQLATTGEFREPKQTPVGWAPTRITITDHAYERLRARRKHDIAALKNKASGATNGALFTETGAADPHAYRNGTLDLWIGAANGILFPSRMRATTPDGATSTWTFSNTKVNVGLGKSAFRL
ncbi:MAG TPA: hypothetical protein VGM37_03035 [Armatimonadota bacterium]|jgi:outer membrane lipoprotein-sorting protein